MKSLLPVDGRGVAIRSFLSPHYILPMYMATTPYLSHNPGNKLSKNQKGLLGEKKVRKTGYHQRLPLMDCGLQQFMFH